MAGDNRLSQETSPYLLQHAGNPVDWRPWGAAALEEAQAANKPILLSIGYAACHWCHVMAHESFEDPASADVMNRLFVNIKVDREERPDIDQIYMAALHALGQQGGWPLTMFLTPTAEPFYGGTYFPRTSMYGRPSFTEVLEAIAGIFRDEGDKVRQNQDALVAHLRSLYGSRAAETEDGSPAAEFSEALVDQASGQLLSMMDPDHGGLKGAPKFPNAQVLKLLLLHGLRHGRQLALDAVDLALTKMSQGGIYDHIGGGFSRYTVDHVWLVPHFEKMLYDNAQLIDLLSLSAARSGNALHRDRIAETVAWLVREMRQTSGAFAASLDADSEGEEGKFYVWDKSEIDDLLGEDAPLFDKIYDVTRGGNWEGRNILNRLSQRTYADADIEATLAHCRQRLLARRAERIPPALDDKVLADWNGLMIAALARAGARLEEADWVSLAATAYAGIRASMIDPSGRLAHAERAGSLTRPGFASDYAAMAEAALALHEATGEENYQSQAIELMKRLDQHHSADNGGLFTSADDADDVWLRPRAETDEAVPCAAGIAAGVWVRLWLLTGDSGYRDRADRLFAATAGGTVRNAFAGASLLAAFDMRLHAPQLVVVGPTDSDARPFILSAYRAGHPHLVVQRLSPGTDLGDDHPAAGKVGSVDEGATAAFLCVGPVCSLPIADAGDVATMLASMVQAPTD